MSVFQKIFSSFCFLLFLVFFLFPSFSWSIVVFKGISKKEEIDLKKTFSFLKQKKIEKFQIDQIIKQLMQNENYEKVYAFEKNKNVILIEAVPVKKIQSLFFSGHKSFSRKKMLEIVNLSSQQKFRPFLVFEARIKLIQFYKSEGYYNAKVQLVLDKRKDLVRVNFIIDEGKPCLIQSIDILTENQSLKKQIYSKMKLEKGKVCREKFLKSKKESLKKFLKEQFFFHSKLYEKINYKEKKRKAQIEYRITDPYKYKLNFKGNKHFNDLKLKKKARWRKISSWSLDFIFEIKKRIQNFYLNSGYSQMTLDHVIKENKRKYEREIVFHIKEGRKTKIEKIDVFGDLSRPSQFYAHFIRKNSTKLIAKGYYSRKDFEIGYKNLIKKLKDEGYFNAKIHSSKVKFLDKEKGKAYVLLFLSEGPLLRISFIGFSGNKKFSNQSLSKVIPLKKGSPLKQNELKKSIQNLKDFYMTRAYLDMKLANEDDLIRAKNLGASLDVSFKIEEGPQVQVSSINVVGNKITRRNFIINKLKFKKGQFLTKEKIKQSIRSLNETRLFSRVQIRSLEEGTKASKRTVIVSVVENNPGLFKFSFGANSERDFMLKGVGQLSYNNLFGTARALDSRVEGFWNFKEIRYLENVVTLSYLEPLFLTLPIKGELIFSRSERAFDFKTREKIAIMQRSYRAEGFLEHFFTSFLSLRWIVYDLNSVGDFVFPRKKIGEEIIKGKHRISSTGARIFLNLLNDSFSPTRGFSFILNTSYASPNLGGSQLIEYVKTEARYAYYLPLFSHRWIFAHSIRGGYLKNLSNEPGSGIPASQIFILGGSTTIRGFSRGSEPIPSRSELPIDSGNDLTVTGQSYYYLGKFEFHFPLSLPFLRNLGGVIFYDLGGVIVYQREEGLRERKLDFKRPLRQSVGFEFRIKTPLAPLVGGFGYKIKPLEHESRWRLHFSIGLL